MLLDWVCDPPIYSQRDCKSGGGSQIARLSAWPFSLVFKVRLLFSPKFQNSLEVRASYSSWFPSVSEHFYLMITAKSRTSIVVSNIHKKSCCGTQKWLTLPAGLKTQEHQSTESRQDFSEKSLFTDWTKETVTMSSLSNSFIDSTKTCDWKYIKQLAILIFRCFKKNSGCYICKFLLIDSHGQRYSLGLCSLDSNFGKILWHHQVLCMSGCVLKVNYSVHTGRKQRCIFVTNVWILFK